LKVLYFTNIFPHYRIPIWKELLNSTKFSIEIFYSKSKFNQIKDAEIKDKIFHENKSNLKHLKNYKFFGYIFWQSKALIKSIFSDYDVIFLLGDMKIISNWIVPLVVRLRNKKVVYWTHGIYGNESTIKKAIRLIFLNLATDILLYENRAKKILVKHGFDTMKLHVVFNSLDYNNQKIIFKKLMINSIDSKSIKNRIVFIGRLTKVKKIEMLVNAIINLNFQKKNFELVIIGDGPRKPYLERIVNLSICKKNIKFMGSLYDETKISKVIFNSDLCVSPGNIGLSCIHSLTYGTPVCTHENFNNQMPEAEAIKSGENGIFFKENDIIDLQETILRWFENHHNKNSRQLIRKIVDEKYNPKYQMKVINNMIDKWQK
jgi:glycosyltransferase involved in cell wall biosynthesis